MSDHEPRRPRSASGAFPLNPLWSSRHDPNRARVLGFHPRYREVYINGERIKDVTRHPMLKPLIDIRARIYDMQHESATRPVLSYQENGEWQAVANKLPRTQEDWWAKRRATDSVLEAIGGVVTRVGDETGGEMWSLFDGQDVLNEVDPQFSANIRRHVEGLLKVDPFHVSANTDPKGDRSKPPQEQDPDMLLHVVRETDAGVVVRGAQYETAAAYANQAFTKLTIANWGNSALSDYAVGFVCDLGSANLNSTSAPVSPSRSSMRRRPNRGSTRYEPGRGRRLRLP